MSNVCINLKHELFFINVVEYLHPSVLNSHHMQRPLMTNLRKKSNKDHFKHLLPMADFSALRKNEKGGKSQYHLILILLQLPLSWKGILGESLASKPFLPVHLLGERYSQYKKALQCLHEHFNLFELVLTMTKFSSVYASNPANLVSCIWRELQEANISIHRGGKKRISI